MAEKTIILDDVEKVEEFVNKSSDILQRLLNLRRKSIINPEILPSKRELIYELKKTKDLVDHGVEDGISNTLLFYEQVRIIIEVFKMFDDIIPEVSKIQ